MQNYAQGAKSRHFPPSLLVISNRPWRDTQYFEGLKRIGREKFDLIPLALQMDWVECVKYGSETFGCRKAEDFSIS
jgi:hypothetical protein